jgi:hypothetical protein
MGTFGEIVQPHIPSSTINLIMAELGFPHIKFEDLKITEPDAVELFVVPAMKKYFAYYPIVYKKEYAMTSTIEIDFPTEDTFGVSQARVIPGGTGAEADPTIALSRFNVFKSSYNYKGKYTGNVYNPYYDPYYNQSVRGMENLARQASVSVRKVGNIEVNRDTRTVHIYSSLGGKLLMYWARWSNDWSVVRFENEFDVIALAKANALRYFGMLRSQTDPNTGVALSGDTFTTRADGLEEKVIEKWSEKVTSIVLR